MAYATGDLNGSGPFYVGLDIWVGAQDTPGNQSRFDWVLYIGCTSNGWGTWAGNAQYWSTNIAGVGYSGTFTLDFRPSGSSGRRYAIASGSTWVGHNADGTRPGFPNYGSIDTDHSSVGDGTATTWVDAPTIARATQPTLSASSFDAGTAVTINTPRASGSFTHTLKYSFGSATGTIATGVATSQSWTPPLSLLSQIPNAASGTGTITCETYSGATLIGTKTVGFTLTAGSAIVPDFTTVTSSETVTAVSTNVGAYVQNLSKLALAITGAAGVYGSTIASYKIEVAGQTINSASGTTPAVISASGTVPIVGTVTDSRGRTKSKTVNVTVLPYTPPVITSLDVVRATSGGTPNPDGTYLKLTMNAAVQSLVNGTQKNLLTYQVWTRPMGTTTWVSKGSWTSGIAFNSSRTIGTGGEYSIGSSYEIQITVSDRFNSITAIRSTATTAVPFDISATGTGHGKIHERGALDVGGDGYFTGKVEVDGNLIVDGSVSFGGVVFSPSSWMRGTTAQRDAFFGTPTTDAARAALANLRAQWWNTEKSWLEVYYAPAGTAGLTVQGILAGRPAGWYPISGNLPRVKINIPTIGGISVNRFKFRNSPGYPYWTDPPADQILGVTVDNVTGLITLPIVGTYAVSWNLGQGTGSGNSLVIGAAVNSTGDTSAPAGSVYDVNGLFGGLEMPSSPTNYTFNSSPSGLCVTTSSPTDNITFWFGAGTGNTTIIDWASRVGMKIGQYLALDYVGPPLLAR